MKPSILIAVFVAFIVATTLVAASEEGAQEGGAGGAEKFFSAGLAVSLCGLGAGFAIARVGSASAGAITENPSLFGNTILYVAFAEAIAIYGLLVALMIVMG